MNGETIEGFGQRLFPDASLTDAEKTLVGKFKYVLAIKSVRERTGMDLLAAKRVVDKYRGLPPEHWTGKDGAHLSSAREVKLYNALYDVRLRAEQLGDDYANERRAPVSSRAELAEIFDQFTEIFRIADTGLEP